MHLAAALARVRMRFAFGAVLMVIVSTLLVQSAGAVSADVVISQVYGGGGNAGATLKNDFIELFNRGDAAVDLSGWSVQYASSAGNTWQRTNLSGVLAPGQYYLVQEAQGAGGTTDLPTPDATGTIAMSATSGKVALVTSTALLTCGGAPNNCFPNGAIRDFVGYGTTADNFEGAGRTGTLSNTTAALRGGNGCVETDNNNSDFAVGAPNPRNTASPTATCASDLAPAVTARTPAPGAAGVEVGSNVSVTFSEPVDVTGSWFQITCAASGLHSAAVSGGPETFTLNPDSDFGNGESCAVTVFASGVTDQDTSDPPNNMAGNDIWSFATETTPTEIHQIQGAAHTSPLVGTAVSGVQGVVTARRSNGYYMQDPTPDANDSTSDAIFVFTSSAPTAAVGDAVRVSGSVVEFRPGGSGGTNNLSLTEISGPTTTVVSSGNPLPATTVIGSGGRTPPTSVIEDDTAGNVETSGVFDPAQDGIDFYESLEAMRVQVNNPVAMGPRNSFGELFVLPDNGAGAGVRTSRGGIVIRDLDTPFDYASGDFNPERIQLDDALGVPTPNAHVGDHFTGAAIGVVDYEFGNFEIELMAALTRVDNGLTRETTDAPAANELSVATFNVENLGGNEAQAKYDALAGQIVNNMRAPDIVSLEEIQDNNGATNDAVVDADVTLARLVAAITAAGGPSYEFRQINPVDDQDGGQPGGNIRVGFIFRTDRGLAFVDRAGGGSTTPTTVVSGPGGPQLSSSPGRVDPTNSAWNASRKPLAGEFTYRGETFFLITNHFNSKGGDQPLFGRFQPPVRTTETQRHQQAQIVNDFVDSILAVDPNANVAVLGDINDFEFSQTMNILEGGVLHALMSTLPQEERYSYVFEGNSQSLDHIVVSDSLFSSPFEYDAVHVNAEFFDQLSDHDPQVARFLVNTAPTADAGGPYTVAEGGSVAIGAAGSDADGDALTYEWDLDNDGTFETSGQSPTFSAATLDGPSTHTVTVRVSDGTASATDQATVTVDNVPPTATLSAPAEAFAGFAFTIALTDATDVSAADRAAGFTYAFDCGDGSGYGAFGSSSSRSCPTTGVGTRTVRAKIRDKDGGITEYTGTVQVVVTFASLCDLVAAYSTDPTVTEQLCQKLEQAAAAPTAVAREGHLNAFRNHVDAKIGKGITEAQAAILKELSTSL